jgi:GNAT superfamily N-acetyltransferase
MEAVERLARSHEPAIQELLEQDEVINLFLLGFLQTHPVDRAWWYGVLDGDRVLATVLVLPGRLAVPYCPEPSDAARLGEHLYHLHRPSLLVGPREASDALWKRWTRDRRPTRAHDQRLYVLDAAPAGDDPPGFRRASYTDWPAVADLSAAMELEDLGIDPAADNPLLHNQVVRERVNAGRTWIIERDGEILFQVNVGTTNVVGCQIGGTYVPPRHRGRGLAKVGIAALGRRLLARYPRVTLHVNEANVPAVRVYEHVGYRRDAAFRLITP